MPKPNLMLVLLVVSLNLMPKPNLMVVVGCSRQNFLMVVDRVLEPVVLAVEVELTLLVLLLPWPLVPWLLVVSTSVWDLLWVPVCSSLGFCCAHARRRTCT
jgi:hypothetical protein